jgi:hypothetical protein
VGCVEVVFSFGETVLRRPNFTLTESPLHACAHSEVEAEIIVFTKYIHHAEEEDGDDETALLEGKQGLSECTAWLCRRPISQWERLVYFLRLSAPEEGAMWIRIQVKPMTMRFGVDNGEFRTRPVNVVDCHAQTALFVNPFIKLYQVRR